MELNIYLWAEGSSGDSDVIVSGGESYTAMITKCERSNQGELGRMSQCNRCVSSMAVLICQFPRKMNSFKELMYLGFRTLLCFSNCKDVGSDFWKKRVLPVMEWCLWYTKMRNSHWRHLFPVSIQCLTLLCNILKRSLTCMKTFAQNHLKHFLSHLHFMDMNIIFGLHLLFFPYFQLFEFIFIPR